MDSYLTLGEDGLSLEGGGGGSKSHHYTNLGYQLWTKMFFFQCIGLHVFLKLIVAP
jgi:hypothetical protein